jgi:hypothetical protein
VLHLDLPQGGLLVPVCLQLGDLGLRAEEQHMRIEQVRQNP